MNKLNFILPIVVCMGIGSLYGIESIPENKSVLKLEEAIANHNVQSMQNLLKLPISLTPHEKSELAQKASQEVEKTRQSLTGRLDIKGTARIGAGLACAAAGMYLGKELSSFLHNNAVKLVNKNNFPYGLALANVYKDQYIHYGATYLSALVGICFGIKQIYQGFTKYDRTQTYRNALAIERLVQDVRTNTGKIY